MVVLEGQGLSGNGVKQHLYIWKNQLIMADFSFFKIKNEN